MERVHNLKTCQILDESSQGDLSYIASFWQDIYSFSDVTEQLRQIEQSSQSKHKRVSGHFWLFLLLTLCIAQQVDMYFL